MSKMSFFWVCSILLLIATGGRAEDAILFNRDIRPILSEHCFQCHGPDKNKRKADLRLDNREAALRKEAFVPGNASQSELVKRVLSNDPEAVMPPESAHKPLNAAQKELLKKWIDRGAEYQPHWAYINPVRPAVPGVKREGWENNPIDAFILSALQARKMKPSPEADRQRLIRRVYLDLIGLPPTTEQVQKFVEDNDPKAYEKVVDSLLASPHFGERMAIPWLDLVRFADTVGYHGDQNQRIFPYRDYVIEAFNKNKPFDEFTREQIAGDLLANPTEEQLIASGYNRLNMMTREGGAQPKEYLTKYQADRVRTTSITWLGSTFGCAECHDHKYDPITAKDFYSFSAFFADLRQWGVYSDYNYTPNPDLKGWSNDHPFPPELEVRNTYLTKQMELARDRANHQIHLSFEKSKSDAALAAKFNRWVEENTKKPFVWRTPAPTEGKDFKIKDSGQIVFTGKAVKGGSQTLEYRPQPGWVTTIRLEALPSAEHKNTITRDGAATALIQVTFALKNKEGKETKLGIQAGRADRYEIIRWASTVPFIGLDKGQWRTAAGAFEQAQSAYWLLEKPVYLKEGDELLVTLKSDNLGSARVSLSPLDDVYDNIDSELGNPFKTLNSEHRQELGEKVYRLFFKGTGADPESFKVYREAMQICHEMNRGKAWTQVSVASTPITTRVLPRGNFLDETGTIVEPAVPSFLPQIKKVGDSKRLNRLDLANWIVSRENPLTARVFMNRLWKQFFGTGISAVMEDVGAQGEWPSHPELLDWLAVEFRESGWDVKRMVKLIALSATYRQDSKARAEYREIDPNNRFLSYLPPRRLEAEFVRDNALEIAGLLNEEVGGPSVKPYQPEGYYANIQFPDRRYVADADLKQYRRGIYMHWQRTFLHPMLANFDAPSREECTASRNNANTPQQALTLLNDPSFVEAARVLAEKLLASDAVSDDARIQWLYHRALARSATEKEVQSLRKFLATQKHYYLDNPDEAKKLIHTGIAPLNAKVDAVELATWSSVCRVILNLHEVITRY